MSSDGLGAWDPLTPAGIAALFGECDAPWWIAGGYAIDAFVRRFDRRPHGDIDVGLLARDQHAVRSCLPGWDFHCADPPGTLRPWRRAEFLREPIHDVWVRESRSQPWRLALVLNPDVSGVWVYRRDERIRRPLSELVWRSDGIPFLAPEVQLLFKSKTIRPKDEQDFADCARLLDLRQAGWLRDALRLIDPTHVWLRLL